MRATLMAFAAAVAVATACGGTGQFGLTSEDNDPAKLAEAFQRVDAPPPGPKNALGKPMAFLVARGKPEKKIIAFDLQAKKELWRVDAAVDSKVVVGKPFIAHVADKGRIVGRDVTSGAQLWSHDLEGTLIGIAADQNNVYYTVKDGGSWFLGALSGTDGAELWEAESNGALGAPAARGGLVFSPFLKQWLAILDANTGEQLTRIRGIDEEISFVRTTPSNVFFGSKAGVFLLDERAASGKRAQSTYGSAALPEEFVRVHYHWDAFDPIQAGYSAYDRNRILWDGAAEGDELAFSDDRVVVHTYRFFFGFNAETGELEWAFNHPRVDVVASAHVGPVIGFAAMLGGIGALDPATGQRVYEAKVKGQLLGATFDADGWAPSEKGAEPQGIAAALASIAMDRDARFTDVKKFAVTALSKIDGPSVTRDLIGLIQNERTQQFLYETAVEQLVARKDPSGLPHLLKVLETKANYLEDTKPRGVGVVAQAIAAMRNEKIPDKLRKQAFDALVEHLRSPATSPGDLVAIVRALGAVGSGGELQPLSSFLLVYRADPSFSTQIDAVSATIDVLLQSGGMAERELVAFVAEDPRTQSGVAEYASRALLQQTTPGSEEGAGEEGEKSDEKPATKPGKQGAAGGKAQN